jgi:hypothetical protein
VIRVLGGGFDVEGEDIGGEDFDPMSGTCDLDSTFTVRCDDGALFQMHSWRVELAAVESRPLGSCER